MRHQQIQPFNIMGIAVRTTSENVQSLEDIPVLWNRFIWKGIADSIPNKIDQSIYCSYTDYEKDYTKPYTTVKGCRVEQVGGISTGTVGETFSGVNSLYF